jgi:hypothetical protein
MSFAILKREYGSSKFSDNILNVQLAMRPAEAMES